LLTFAAGYVSAVGYRGLFGVFVGQMTGNIIVASSDIATGHAGTLTPVMAVPAFLLGAAASAILTRTAARRGWPHLPLHCMTWSGLVVCFATATLFAAPFGGPDDKAATIVAAIGAFAMGWLSGLGRVELSGMPSSVVMTTNVTTGMVDAINLSYGDRRALAALARYIPTIVAFCVGAVLGSIVFDHAGFASLFAASLIGLGCALLAPRTA
jgi:uncharacterized membrane protein YoaK (UPF0700 family)